jgi:hypothetical protein
VIGGAVLSDSLLVLSHDTHFLLLAIASLYPFGSKFLPLRADMRHPATTRHTSMPAYFSPSLMLPSGPICTLLHSPVSAAP